MKKSFIISITLLFFLNLNAQEKENNKGFSLGLNIYTLEVFGYYYPNKIPDNAFYFKKSIYPSINYVFLSKKNYIHSFEFGFQYHDETNYDNSSVDKMGITNTDYMFAYMFEIPLNNKAFNSNLITPYIGIKLLNDNKTFSVTHHIWGGANMTWYNTDFNNKSNLFLIQISPSIKQFYKHIYWDFGLNFNLAGFAFGHISNYNYSVEYNSQTKVLDDTKENYSSYLSLKRIYEDKFFVHNISLKIGYIF